MNYWNLAELNSGSTQYAVISRLKRKKGLVIQTMCVFLFPVSDVLQLKSFPIRDLS